MLDDPVATGSIAMAPSVAALTEAGSSDWDSVKRALATLPPATKTEAVPWKNTDTGNSGTISDIIASTADGRPCRHFSTTVSSIDGIQLYKAEMCRDRGGDWSYTRVEPYEATDSSIKPKG